MSMRRDYSSEFAVYDRTVENRRTVFYRGLRWSVTVHHRTAIVIPGGITTMTTSHRHTYATRTDRYKFLGVNHFFYLDGSKGMHFHGDTQVIGIDEEFRNEARAHMDMIPANTEEVPF
jgi:hypothetical protein